MHLLESCIMKVYRLISYLFGGYLWLIGVVLRGVRLLDLSHLLKEDYTYA